MEDRLQQLRKRTSISEADKMLLNELAMWVESKHVRPCDECRGVGMVRFAFTGILGDKSFIIGRADEGQAGHCPQPKLGSFATLEEAQGQAESLNAANGLDKATASRIVISTIRAQHLRERASHRE
jgi:hypothetical protein